MEYVVLAISQLSGAIFIFYILKMVFGEKLSTKAIFIIYNLIMVGNALVYFISTDDWIGSVVSLIPYLTVQVLVFNFKSLFNLNFRSKNFKKRLKKESLVYSSFESKKLISKIFIGISVTLFLVSLASYFIDKSNVYKSYSIVGMVVSAIMLCIVVLIKLYAKKQIKDSVVLVVGTKNPILYETSLNSLKTKEKDILTDDRYIVDFVGRIYIDSENHKQVNHIYLITNDKATYEAEQFKIIINERLINVLGEFQRYTSKEIYVIEKETSYEIKKIINL